MENMTFDCMPSLTKEELCKRRKERQRKRMQHRLLILGVGLLTLAVIIILITVLKPQSEKGFWTIDGVTSYRFDGKGNGALVLPTKEYEFSYKKKDGRIYIDFIDDAAKDTAFKYTFKNGALVFIAESDSSKQAKEFVMKPIDK